MCWFFPGFFKSFFPFTLIFSSFIIMCVDFFQISSVSQSCPTLCDIMNRSMPGLPVHHQLLESTQTHVHQVGDAIQPSYPLSSLLLLPPIPPSIRETLSTQQLSKEGIKSRIIQLPRVIGGCFCFAICIHSFILFFRFHIEVIIVICPFLSDLLH